MTWTARCTVTAVEPGPDGLVIDLAANAADMVEPYLGVDACPAIISNTEGRISEVKLSLVLDEAATSVEVGDLITVQGHFDGRGAEPTAASPAPPDTE